MAKESFGEKKYMHFLLYEIWIENLINLNPIDIWINEYWKSSPILLVRSETKLACVKSLWNIFNLSPHRKGNGLLSWFILLLLWDIGAKRVYLGDGIIQFLWNCIFKRDIYSFTHIMVNIFLTYVVFYLVHKGSKITFFLL